VVSYFKQSLELHEVIVLFFISVDHGATVAELLSDLAEGIDGEPVAIAVSRRNLLKSATIAAQKAGFSYSRPPVISFVGEDAEDDGGPRREFFRLVHATVYTAVFHTVQ